MVPKKWLIQGGTEIIVSINNKSFCRTLPIAALCGIGISAVVYIAINMAYFGVLTIEEFKSSDTVAVVRYRQRMRGVDSKQGI